MKKMLAILAILLTQFFLPQILNAQSKAATKIYNKFFALIPVLEKTKGDTVVYKNKVWQKTCKVDGLWLQVTKPLMSNDTTECIAYNFFVAETGLNVLIYKWPNWNYWNGQVWFGYQTKPGWWSADDNQWIFKNGKLVETKASKNKYLRRQIEDALNKLELFDQKNNPKEEYFGDIRVPVDTISFGGSTATGLSWPKKFSFDVSGSQINISMAKGVTFQIDGQINKFKVSADGKTAQIDFYRSQPPTIVFQWQSKGKTKSQEFVLRN